MVYGYINSNELQEVKDFEIFFYNNCNNTYSNKIYHNDFIRYTLQNYNISLKFDIGSSSKVIPKNLEKLLDSLATEDVFIVKNLESISTKINIILHCISKCIDKHAIFISIEDNIYSNTECGMIAINSMKKIIKIDKEFKFIQKNKGIEKAKNNKVKFGRRTKDIDYNNFKLLCNKIDNFEITSKEASRELGISLSTLNRRRLDFNI